MSGANSLTPEDGRLYVTEGGAITRTVADILSSPSRAKAAATMADLRSSKTESCTGGLGCCNPHGDCPKCGCAGKIERLTRQRDDYCRQLTQGIPVVRDLTLERDRLRAALDRLDAFGQQNFVGSVTFETIRKIVREGKGSPDETSERQYKGTRESFYCPDCQCPNCGNTRAAVPPLTPAAAPVSAPLGVGAVAGVNHLIGAAAQPTPGSWGIFCGLHGFTEWRTACPKCEPPLKAGERPRVQPPKFCAVDGCYNRVADDQEVCDSCSQNGEANL